MAQVRRGRGGSTARGGDATRYINQTPKFKGRRKYLIYERVSHVSAPIKNFIKIFFMNPPHCVVNELQIIIHKLYCVNTKFISFNLHLYICIFY